MQAQQANIIFFKYSPSNGLSFLFNTVSVPALPKLYINYLPLYLFFPTFLFCLTIFHFTVYQFSFYTKLF